MRHLCDSTSCLMISAYRAVSAVHACHKVQLTGSHVGRACKEGRHGMQAGSTCLTKVPPQSDAFRSLPMPNFHQPHMSLK